MPRDPNVVQVKIELTREVYEKAKQCAATIPEPTKYWLAGAVNRAIMNWREPATKTHTARQDAWPSGYPKDKVCYVCNTLHQANDPAVSCRATLKELQLIENPDPRVLDDRSGQYMLLSELLALYANPPTTPT